MSTKIDFHLNPDSRLDTKWLKTDLEEALKKNVVPHYWNELLKDNELIVHGCLNTEDSSGSVNDPNSYCRSLSIERSTSKKLKSDIEHFGIGHERSQRIIDSWVFSKTDDVSSLAECIRLLQTEQRLLCSVVAGNSTSACRLQQRVVVAYRYFLALTRHQDNQRNLDIERNWSNEVGENIGLLDQFLDNESSELDSSYTETQKGIHNLTRIGIATVMSFTFASLRRAWRSGEDIDICSEMLQETLESLQKLPEALLFEEDKISPVSIDILEKSTVFLRQVVLSEMMNGVECKVPLIDRQYSLQILLELAIQRGTITAVLDAVLLLMTLSEKSYSVVDNRSDMDENTSPLVPFLKRFQSILRSTCFNLTGHDLWCDRDNDENMMCPTECFLRFLELPNEDKGEIDLKFAAVIMMSYLNQLIMPYLPTAAFLGNKKLHQMVYAWGWLPWEPHNKLTICEKLGEIGVIQITFSDKFLFLLSHDKKLYSYNYISEGEAIEFVVELGDKCLEQVATHPEGRHYLALTAEGTVYSWGNGDGGRLGHGDVRHQEHPTLITSLLKYAIVKIACGSSYSAAITSHGELFTWGRGNYGRLGHGTNDDSMVPQIVEALKGSTKAFVVSWSGDVLYQPMFLGICIIDVACGCGDAQTLAVTDTGLLYSWGDGDYGKLGRGGSEASKIPKLVESLRHVKVSNAVCGSQFSIAVTADGDVYSWGKGDHYRLGHGSEEHLRFPRKITGLEGLKVKKVAVGICHTIVLLENGDIYGWGKKEYAHPTESEASGTMPELVMGIRSNNVSGIACGVSQCLAWTAPNNSKVGPRVPFVTDLHQECMSKLNKLLVTVCEGVTTISDRPPSQEKECLIVATLNVLQLQLHAICVNNFDVKLLDLDVGSGLLTSIKQTVIDVASANGVLETIQSAAQATLQAGWSVLLPTADERAKALCSLMPPSDWHCNNMSPGQHFMTDLLVSSLMSDGGLEISLQVAIKTEMSKEACNGTTGNFSSIPLVQLIKQLLRNCQSQALSHLQQLKTLVASNERTPSLTLLLKFQRLLVAQIYQNKSCESQYSWERDDKNIGAESLLHKYLQLLVDYVSLVVNTATAIASRTAKHYHVVCHILKCNGVEVLLPELLVCLVMLHEEIPLLLHHVDWLELFEPLFTALESFHNVAPYRDVEDDDDMSWPGVTVNLCSSVYKNGDDLPYIRRMDVENHNRDKGSWIVYNNKVYECQESNNKMKNLATFLNKDSMKREKDATSSPPPDLLQISFVGNYLDPEEDILQPLELSCASFPTLDIQRTLAYLLGFHARCIVIGTPLLQIEKDLMPVLSAPYLKGGLTPSNPYEEKHEARSTNTTPTEPLMMNGCPLSFTDNFENPSNDVKLLNTVVAFDEYLTRKFKQPAFLNLGANHPIEEVNKMLLAALIKHLALGPLVFEHLREGERKPVEYFEIISNVLFRTKLKLMQMKQKQNQSYKELCAPFLNKLRFLVYEVRPATSHEVNAIDHLQLLYTESQFKKMVKRVLVDLKQSQFKVKGETNSELHEKWEETNDEKLHCSYSQSCNYTVQVKPGKPELVQAIVDFVTEENSADVELIRKAMSSQNERFMMRKQGYEFMLKLLKLPTAVPSVKYNIVNGWVFTSAVSNSEELNNINTGTPHQRMELVLAKAEILRWTMTKLHETVVQSNYSSRLSPNKNINGCYSQSRLRWIRLVLSIIGLLSEANSGEEVSLLVNSDLFACIEFIMRESAESRKDTDATSKTALSSFKNDVQAIFEDEPNSSSRQDQTVYKPTTIPVATGPGVVPYLKLGLRVVRGPDWKWGDQDNSISGEGTVIGSISSDGWVPVKWDSGTRNTYRMGKDGKYDLQLAPPISASYDRSPDIEEENGKEIESERTKLRNPTDILRTALLTLIKTVFLCAGLHADKLQLSSIRKLSHYMRFNLQESIRQKSMKNETGKSYRGWANLTLARVISSSQSWCSVFCSPQWLHLALNFICSNNQQSLSVDLTSQIEALRFLNRVLPVGLTDEDTFTEVIEKLFQLLGDIAIVCYPDTPLFNLVERKPVVALTASATSTIVEEFVLMLRRFHKIPKWTGKFNEILSSKLATATDFLSHPAVSTQGDKVKEMPELQNNSMATLLVFGGLDSRPRLGGDVMEKGLRSGTISNILNKPAMIVVQMHDNNKLEQFSLDVIKSLPVPQLQLEKLPVTNALLDTLATLVSVASSTYSPKSTGTSLNVPLLRSQQQTLVAIKAGRLLLNYQSRLRKVLKCPTLEPHMSLEALNDVNIIGNATQSLLLHQLIINAVQPSSLKPNFDRKELEKAAVIVSQYLATDAHVKRTSIDNDQALTRVVVRHSETRCPSPPMTPLAAQLNEMGFSKRAIEKAIKVINNMSETDIDRLVAWLLENSSEDGCIASERFNSRSKNERDTCKESSSGVNPLTPLTFMKRTDFASADEYATYVRNNCAAGMTVRCCRSYEEEVYEGDTGVIIKINNGELHDLNLQVDWKMKGYAYWVRFIHVELLGHQNTTTNIKVGDTVRVKQSVITPQYKWGSITHNSVGIVTAVTRNNHQVTVEFPQQTNWIGSVSEMEILPPHHQEISCNYCFMRPIVGARFKCKICDNFNYCENCFYAPYDHPHNFVRIAEPGSAAIFAGKPRKVERHGISPSFDSDIIEDNTFCIKSITTSSRESWALHLLDVFSDNYWQSCGSQGKHWIRMEMCADVLIHSLKIKVEPSDTSYMPSLIKVSVGNSFSTLQELAAVSVHPRDTIVTLLADMHEFYPYVEIAIKQCQNGGIDCKVHAINVTGKRKSSIDLPSSAAFLALDYNDIQNSAQYASDQTNLGLPLENKVFVWGLNDKDQLGGLKGSKIKFPAYSETLSALRPIQIAGGSKSLFIVSNNGKVYACGETTNGRLGLSTNISSPMPRQIITLNQYIVKKVAVHSGGKHAMALTLSGKVFSWGEGDDGKLGHGNSVSLDRPKMIECFKSKRIKEIACGSAYSAAITSCGELYTWGLGEYGRLGHGDAITQCKPKLVRALLGRHIVKVACGSRDAQTLALDNEGVVYSWGDGDFGKLGRGGSEPCDIPHPIELLNGKGVVHIDCGAQFSLALTKSGQIWTWGKGDYYRLGLGTDQHVRKPTLVTSLKGIHIVDVAVGALHCLAVSSTGVVFSWGDNDHGQQGNGSTMVNQKPTAVDDFGNTKVNRVACGSSHSIAWQAYEPPVCMSIEPVSFNSVQDPLGLNILSLNETNSEEDMNNSESLALQPSLAKQILSLESNVAKQTALQHVLNSLRVMYARDAVVAALSSSVKVEDKSSTEEKDNLEEMVTSTVAHMSADIVQGGGEAPATAMECSDELATSSNLTTPDELDNPLNAFPSVTSSSSTSYHMNMSKISASTMSMVAATLKSNSQVIGVTESDMVNSSLLDDFIGLLELNDVRILVDLLKLAVAGRVAEHAKETLTNVLKVLATSDSSIAAMLLELCVIELEDVALNNNILQTSPQPIVQESAHPYSNQITTNGIVRIPGADSLRLEFDRRCSTEKNRDMLTIFNPMRTTVYILSGRDWNDWSIPLFVQGEELRWKFMRDTKNNGWGWKFTVHPIMGKKQFGSDRDILSKPTVDVVMCLLDSCITPDENLVKRLAIALASCAQLSTLNGKERMWCLEKLCKFMKSPLRRMFSLPTLLEVEKEDSPLSSLLKALPKILLKQYEYEDQIVKRGKQLMYSPFFKALVALACELELNTLSLCGETGKWAWFRHYCIARKVADSLIRRAKIPNAFCLEVRKIIELDPSYTEESSTEYENNELFTQEHDEQLLMWLNRKPENWNISWSGSGIIYGWGHNHRGQLGGVSGNQVKVPTPCEALTALRPVYLAGGEQSLFAITSEGRVYATGFADKGRLGIGSLSDWNPHNPFVNTPYLVEGLSKVFIKKVAVHSGGKHCLALSSIGLVYAWGDGEDGKLGLGHKNTCFTPCLVENLSDKEIIDVSCGGAHSAAITRSGKLYTWGRGRYGRLGHGSGDDQLLPKLVEALLGYQVIDVACGSGDAQTLCITADDNVWSWGDGDYGKLGRGGADGCSIPLKIESLAGLGVVKVECGSQFSVALTRSGSVYTWGKGDYYRLGHGTDEHVRRPKKVAGLQGKKVVSISTGSLHVVVCSNKGEVFAWGDNDEGQLGDGTLKAVPRPRAIPALQDKNITLVVCGSAHTFAKSSDKPITRGNNLPAQVPLEYDLLRDMPIPLLRNRLVLLHYFSDLLSPIVNMLPLEGEISLDKLRGILVYSAKEGVFRKVVNTTMSREPHHGPTIDLNRIQVKRSRTKGGYAGVDGIKSVFGQMVQMSVLSKEVLMLPHRVWKVQFVGESVDDYGGGYSESIAEMCEELQNGSLPLLIPTPNGRDDTGANRDCFILNPAIKLPLHTKMFNFLGVLMGIAVRTGSPLGLNLAECVWKQLAGIPLTISDLREIDKDYIPGLLYIRDMNANDKNFLDLPFTTTSAAGQEVSLSASHRRVTLANRQEYIKLALNYRLHEFDEQIAAVRVGMAKVVPVPLLSLFSGYELETMVCGSPDIPLDLLKSVAVYKGIHSSDQLVQWFWEVMEEFTNQERSLFLRFVWGRTRLPRTTADFRGRDFVVQVMDKYQPPDHFLPESYTCFFLLKMPRYSEKFVLREKLKYAIYFCKSIDTDEYARIAFPGGTGLTSNNSDSDDILSLEGDSTPT